MSDIVERLRELEAVESELACECDCPPEATANYRYAMTCAEAADEITRLRSEVEKLTEQEKRQYRITVTQQGLIARLEAEVEKLRSAMDRARAALEEK